MNNTMKGMLMGILTGFVMTFSSDVNAQTDYVINNDGAKIMGEVKSHNVDKVKFIPANEKKAQKFNAEQLKEAYKAGHGVFRSVAAAEGKKPSFMQVLEDGKIKLYEYFKTSTMYGAPAGGFGNGAIGSTYNSTKKRWYAQKDGGEVVEVKSNGIWGSRKNRKDNFFNMIKDNVHVAERYENADKFSFDFVQSLIEEYNALIVKEASKK